MAEVNLADGCDARALRSELVVLRSHLGRTAHGIDGSDRW